MSEKKMNVEKIKYLREYLDVLLRAQTQGMKLTSEISAALKQFEREIDLDGSSYVLVQNGEVIVNNCTFSPADDEAEHAISVKDGKLSFNGLSIGEDAKLNFKGNTMLSRGIYISKDVVVSGGSIENNRVTSSREDEIESLVVQLYKNKTVDSEILKQLNDMNVTIEFSDTGVRWYDKNQII